MKCPAENCRHGKVEVAATETECEKCKGYGTITCPICYGKGVTEDFNNYTLKWKRVSCDFCYRRGYEICDQCKGRKVFRTPRKTVDCKLCGGKGYVELARPRTVLIQGVASGMLLEVPNWTMGYANVQIWPEISGSSSQRWRIMPLQGIRDTACIVSAHSGLALNIRECRREENAEIDVYDLLWTETQQWKFRLRADLMYEIFPVCRPDLRLDAVYPGTEQATQLVLWRRDETSKQLWRLYDV